MIATIIASMLGFVGSAFPDLIKLFRDAQDRKHELAILNLQMQQAAQGHLQKLEEIGVTADIAESKALYKTYSTGIHWVDALNGTVRPIIAYAFFLLYAAAKFMALHAGMPWRIWTDEDQIIFAGIISFYFGSRAMGKMRAGK